MYIKKDYLKYPAILKLETELAEAPVLVSKINELITIVPETVILDAGSGYAAFINELKTLTGVTRAVGIEMQDKLHEKAVVNYPTLELHNDIIQNKLDVIATADVIFFNNTLVPESVFWDIYDSIKVGAVVIYSNITLTKALKDKYGYVKDDFKKQFLMTNIMKNEFNLVIKK